MRPKDEAELAQVIRVAERPFAIQGGGTRGPRATGDRLDLSGLRGITLYEPGALTLIARAGTPLAEVEAILATEGQRLPFEPPDLRNVLSRDGVSTLGGVAAANDSGPRRVHSGACRDSLIGVRFVDGRGQVIRSGGRVMKNVTGLDLVKLMAGSHGTLGVLTEVAFKLLPAPETAASLCLHGQSAGQAVAAMSLALGSAFEISGAAYVTARLQTHLRIEGFEASVAYRLGRLTELLGRQGVEISVCQDSAALWQSLRDVTPLAGHAGDLWRLSVQPSKAPALLSRMPEGSITLLDWGGGRVWARVPQGIDLRAHLGPISGHATLMQIASALPIFAPETREVAALSAALRMKFDPKALFNRGIMG